MEDKIEVGEYVKTIDGKLGIFDRYSTRKDNSLFKSPFNCFIKLKNRKTPLQCSRDYIVKHSKNIIDLIEVGDIVEILTNDISGFTSIVQIINDEQIEILKKMTNKKYIKSIVTKEQFAQVQYLIQEDKSK